LVLVIVDQGVPAVVEAIPGRDDVAPESRRSSIEPQ
jgi:hypothetical protein